MPDPPYPEPQDPIKRLAAMISQRGLREPVAFVLELLSPFDVISSQLALFVQPFSVGWEPYAHALTKESSWHMLRQLLDDEYEQPEHPEHQNQ